MPKKWLTTAESLAYLASHREGRLATCDAEGQPYITPMNYVYLNNKVYVHCAHAGRKLDNIRSNSRVCFEVSHTNKMFFGDKPCNCSTRYMSVLVFGNAQIIEDSSKKVEVLNYMTELFANGRPYQVIDAKAAATCTVVAINIENITGKSNVDAHEV